MRLLNEVRVTMRPNRTLRGTDIHVEVLDGSTSLGKYEFISEDDDFVPFFEFLMQRATKLLLHHARDERGNRLDEAT